MTKPVTETTPKHNERFDWEDGAWSKELRAKPCFCIGPQNGEPLCPCQMRDVEIRNGRYIKKEVDLGPVR